MVSMPTVVNYCWCFSTFFLSFVTGFCRGSIFCSSSPLLHSPSLSENGVFFSRKHSKSGDIEQLVYLEAENALICDVPGMLWLYILRSVFRSETPNCSRGSVDIAADMDARVLAVACPKSM